MFADQYNSVVLSPDPAPDGLIHVYMLAATDRVRGDRGRGPLSLRLFAGRKAAGGPTAIHQVCFNIEAPDPEKGKPVAFILTHLLDPTPTEIHVFLSRLHRQSVMVAAGARVWSVDGGKINLVEQRPN